MGYVSGFPQGNAYVGEGMCSHLENPFPLTTMETDSLIVSTCFTLINLAEKNDLHPHGCWDVLTSEGLGGSLLERKKENSHIQVQHKDFCNSTMVLLKSLTLLLVSDWHCCYDDFMNNVFTVFLFNLCFVPCMQIGQMSPVHACFWVSIFSTLWWALRFWNYLCTARCSALNHSAFLTVQENSHDQPFHTSLKLYQMQRSCPYDNWSHLFVFSGIW